MQLWLLMPVLKHLTVGIPEGRYHLAQATLYLATQVKQRHGLFDALAAIEREREAEVPTHLKDANRDKKGFGHGAGYLYPHAYRDHWVVQQYLPATRTSVLPAVSRVLKRKLVRRSLVVVKPNWKL